MAENNYPEEWMVVDHVIPGVTTEMIDWWWVNMEKGYELWCPDEHKGFKWAIKPPMNGHIGAVQIATESIDYGPVMDLRIEWVDPNLGTQEQKDFWTYEHLLTAGSTGEQPGTIPMVMLSHQYEAIPEGCKMRSCMHGFPKPPPGSGPPPEFKFEMKEHPTGKKPTGGGWPAHNVAEVSTFKNFLPALWGIWQAVSDPAINRKASLKIKKEGSNIIYI
ncbi:MAG: hypothetical protein JXL81_02840 [Deltaproteobacteria bacterium]|nr:hypothetical protein [Deltaproteobacteria bacterium]